MFEDLRCALRSAVRARGVTAIFLASLALGTGVTTTICGVVYSVLFRVPPGVDAVGLVNIYTSEFSGSAYGASSWPDYLSLKDANRTLEAIAAADDRVVQNVR